MLGYIIVTIHNDSNLRSFLFKEEKLLVVFLKNSFRNLKIFGTTRSISETYGIH